MKSTQYIIILSTVMIGCIISIFDRGYGYFEYKYYCNIQTNNRITITSKAVNDTDTLCLSYLKLLDQSIKDYSQQVKIAQNNIIIQPEYSGYRNSYINEVQSKLMQSRILHIQITKAMKKFEQDLFRKTMIYVRYRYKTIRQNLINNLERRDKALNDAIAEGDHYAVLRINKKYRNDKRKLEILNLMFIATNFNELMPFYTMYKKGEFDY